MQSDNKTLKKMTLNNRMKKKKIFLGEYKWWIIHFAILLIIVCPFIFLWFNKITGLNCGIYTFGLPLKKFMTIWIVFWSVIGAVLGMVQKRFPILQFFYRKKPFYRLLSKPYTKIFFIFILFTLLILIVVALYTGIFFNHLPTLLGILIGFVATIIGSHFTDRSIKDIKRTITSYPQLMDCLTKLIDDPSSKEIRIVCYFVLPGYWQVKNKWKRDNFRQAILNAKDKIKIACLTPEDHLCMLIELASRGTRRFSVDEAKTKIRSFHENYEKILSGIENVRYGWENLPYYYFFVTNEKAIIVTPVGLPKISAHIDQDFVRAIAEDIKNGTADKKNEIDEKINEELGRLISKREENDKKTARIDTLGFETSDQLIIEMLWNLFEDYYTEEDCMDIINIESNAKSEIDKAKEAINVLVDFFGKTKINE